MQKISLVSALKNKKKVVAMLVTVLLSIVIVGLYVVISGKNGSKSDQVATQASTYSQYAKNNVTSVDSEREYVNSLQSERSYSEAQKQQVNLLSKTKSIIDATDLLALCITSKVNDLDRCAEPGIDIINKDANKLEFLDAYTLAEMLEKLKDKKSAAIVYQVAYDKYVTQPTNDGVTYKTKEQIKAKIQEFSK